MLRLLSRFSSSSPSTLQIAEAIRRGDSRAIVHMSSLLSTISGSKWIVKEVMNKSPKAEDVLLDALVREGEKIASALCESGGIPELLRERERVGCVRAANCALLHADETAVKRVVEARGFAELVREGAEERKGYEGRYEAVLTVAIAAGHSEKFKETVATGKVWQKHDKAKSSLNKLG
jgi:hypothetical protein